MEILCRGSNTKLQTLRDWRTKALFWLTENVCFKSSVEMEAWILKLFEYTLLAKSERACNPTTVSYNRNIQISMPNNAITCIWLLMHYSKTCLKRSLSKRPKLVFKTDYCLMRVKSIVECSKGSILQCFWPSLSYHLSFRYLLCLFLSGRFRQVLLYIDVISYTN